jgi:hypothetical protein
MKLPKEDSDTLEGLMACFPEIPEKIAGILHARGVEMCAGALYYSKRGWLVAPSIVRKIFTTDEQDLPRLSLSFEQVIKDADWDGIMSPVPGGIPVFIEDALMPLVALRLEHGL